MNAHVVHRQLTPLESLTLTGKLRRERRCAASRKWPMVENHLDDQLYQTKLLGSVMAAENHREMLRDANRRVRDSHKMGMQALGMQAENESAEGDDMGGIILARDIHQHPPQEEKQSLVSKLAPWLAAAALGSGGLLAGLKMAEQKARPTPPGPASPIEYELRIVK